MNSLKDNEDNPKKLHLIACGEQTYCLKLFLTPLVIFGDLDPSCELALLLCSQNNISKAARHMLGLHKAGFPGGPGKRSAA